MSKSKRIVSIIIVSCLLALLVGLSYAYFSTKISGNANTNNIVVTSGNMTLSYNDALQISETDILPGWSKTKEITIKNNSKDSITYKLFWQSLTNNLTDKDDLVYSITCKATSGTCSGLSQQPLPSSAGSIISGQTIASGVTHTYTITFKFLESNNDQSDNIGDSFSGTIFAE